MYTHIGTQVEIYLKDGATQQQQQQHVFSLFLFFQFQFRASIGGGCHHFSDCSTHYSSGKC